MNNQQPAQTLRDGRLKATIWRNDSEKGPFFSVQFSRGYKDQNDQWQDTDSFSGTELLRVSHLATKAYDAIAKLRAEEGQQDEADAV